MNSSSANDKILSTAAAVLLLIAMLVWTVASPVGSSPDEDFHQTMLYCAAKKTEKCLVNGERYGHCYSMRPSIAGNCKNYKELTGPIATKVDYEKTQPLYYKTLSVFVGETLGETTIKIRVVNVIIAMIMAMISIALTCNKFKSALIYALIICTIPSGLFFISSINPSAWTIIFVAASIGPAFSLSSSLLNIRTDKSTQNEFYLNIKRITFILISITFGIGSRFEAMIWFPVIGLLAVLTALVNRKGQKSNYKELVVWLLLFITSIFILRMAFFGKFDSDMVVAISLLKENYFTWRTIEKSLNSIFGMLALSAVPGAELGTHDVPMPVIVDFFISLAIGFSIIYGLSRLKIKQILVFFCLLTIIWIIISILWSIVNWDVYQPRYFLPLLYLITFISLSGIRNSEFANEKWLWMQVLCCIVIVYSIALLSTELRFIYGLVLQMNRYPLGKEAPDINFFRLYDSQTPQWWLTEVAWINPFVAWLMGSICFAIGVFLLWCKVNKK